MHKQEASWISQKLSILPSSDISPALNIGSSTLDYRTKHQPYIDELIFKPLRDRGIRVTHQDIKQAEGIDIFGDLQDATFLEELVKSRFKMVICTNLLEHVEDTSVVVDALMAIVPVGGYLIVTVPSRYPKHMDPIDTMFRPSTTELAGMFPGTQIIDEASIDVGSVWESLSSHFGALVRLFLRLLVPFYRHTGWITALHRVMWLFRRRTIACILLTKVGLDRGC